VNLDLPATLVLALLLTSARAAAFLVLAPPFSSRAVPGTVKALLSVAISLPVLPTVGSAVPALETAAVVSAVVVQVFTGAALGFLCYLVFAAVQAAGDLIDVFGGFSMAQVFDPLTTSGNAVFGRLYHWTALTLLLASGGYTIVLQGFLRSYRAVGLDAGLDLGTLGAVVTGGLGQLVLAAVQIAAPLLAVLFLADVALGLLTRAAPALNAFALGPPFKILLTLMTASVTFVVLPHIVDGRVERMVSTLVQALR
jgi:flagellar biosynthesis protein FliR